MCNDPFAGTTISCQTRTLFRLLGVTECRGLRNEAGLTRYFERET